MVVLLFVKMMLLIEAFHSGLGVRLVLAVGTQHQVDQQLLDGGNDPIHVGGYRVCLLADYTSCAPLQL